MTFQNTIRQDGCPPPPFLKENNNFFLSKKVSWDLLGSNTQPSDLKVEMVTTILPTPVSMCEAGEVVLHTYLIDICNERAAQAM